MQRVGITAAIVVGSTSNHSKHGPGRGLSNNVLAALRSAGIQTERVDGSDRFSTRVAVAEGLAPGEMPGAGRTAIIASGDVFADGLVAGPFAVRGTHPVLLTPPGELLPDVATYLDEADIEHVVLTGGTAALAEPVEDSLDEAGIEVTRLAGATRYHTAILAAELVENRYTEPDGERIAYVRGYQDGDRWVSHILTVNSDGTDTTKLTHGDTNRDRWPRWSPDGTQLAYISDIDAVLVVLPSSHFYDSDRMRVEGGGARATMPNLANEGVLVYTVDTTLDLGQLPVRIAGETDIAQHADFPVLGVGESITVRGYEITVTADDGDTHTVSISKVN